MNIRQVARLLNSVGKITSYEDNCLNEVMGHYENYYRLEKRDGIWEFGLFMVERQNNPYMNKIKEFVTESEGAKYFFLNRLSSFYFSEKVSPFMMNHEELDIGGPTFDEKKLLKAMSLLNIPSSILIGQNQHLQNRGIQLTKSDDSNFIVSFIGSTGNIVKSTIPIELQRALFITFKKVYMLHIFEQEVRDLLEKNNIKNDISDEDINVFLS